jgi:hypothetical protein
LSEDEVAAIKEEQEGIAVRRTKAKVKEEEERKKESADNAGL